MNKKTLVAAVAAVICSVAVCADGFFDGKPLYAKLALGYEMRSVDVPYLSPVASSYEDYATFSDSMSFFKLKPSVGMVLFPEHDNFFLKGLVVEVGLDFGFGGADYDYVGYGTDTSAVTIIPGARAVWNAMIPESRFIPHAFVGFEIPISIVSSEVTGVSGLSDAGWRETTGGFDIDAGVGVTFNVTEKIGVLADFTGFFGTSNGFSFTVGASYRFK